MISYFRIPDALDNKSSNLPLGSKIRFNGNTTRVIPICMRVHPDDRTESDKGISSVQTCSDFLPSFSNEGMCLTRNGLSMNDLIRRSKKLTAFKSIFYSSTVDNTVENISKRQAEYHLTFIIDGNRYNNLKRGKNWNVTSNDRIKIGIHSPEEVADIRGWNNKIIQVVTGHITTINIKPSQQKSEEDIRSLPVTHRKCRFEDEDHGLSSFKNYNEIHCLLDCKMNIAAKICGCRPWSYPGESEENAIPFGKDKRICDFFGNSCFDKILRQDLSRECGKDCVPGCNRISYSIDISKEPIDPKNRICRIYANTQTNLESIIKGYVLAVLERSDDSQIQNHNFSQPEMLMMNKLKGILSTGNSIKNMNITRNVVLERDCQRKIENDLSIVVVSIDSPTFTRTTKRAKGTFFDKFAYIGRISGCFLQI